MKHQEKEMGVQKQNEEVYLGVMARQSPGSPTSTEVAEHHRKNKQETSDPMELSVHLPSI